MSTRTRSLFIILFFISPILFCFVPQVSAQTDGYSEYVTIDSNLVRNFAFDKFNGNNLSGSNEAYGGKLKFEMLPKWELDRENVELVQEYIVGDKLYLYYKVALTNKLNIYTNVKIGQSTPKGLNEIDTVLTVKRTWYRPWWATTYAGFEIAPATITFKHYDFGDVRTFNSLQNTFGGNLEMTFDIDDTPVPETLVDSQGNSHSQEFAYISLSSVGVDSVDTGKLSTDMPQVVGLNTHEEETHRREVTPPSDASKTYLTNAKLGDPKISVSFGEALQFQSVGSNMNPTTKDGDPIWNPKEEKSMEDGRIKFNVGRISPLVYQYDTTLSYTYWHLPYVEQWFTGYWLNGGHYSKDVTITKPSGLHVINRYAQVGIKAVFDIYTCFTIEVPEESPLEDYTLEKPKEYYEDLVWQTSVEGSMQVSADVPDPLGLAGFFGLFGGLGGFITMIITLIIVGIVLWVVVKVVRSGGRGGRTRVDVDITAPQPMYPQPQPYQQPQQSRWRRKPRQPQYSQYPQPQRQVFQQPQPEPRYDQYGNPIRKAKFGEQGYSEEDTNF